MSGACNQRGVEVNSVRSAEQHAVLVTKPLHTEEFCFHRTRDERVVISYPDLCFFLPGKYFRGIRFCGTRVGVFGSHAMLWKST